MNKTSMQFLQVCTGLLFATLANLTAAAEDVTSTLR